MTQGRGQGRPNPNHRLLVRQAAQALRLPVKTLMDFGNGSMDDRYRLTVPASRRRFGRTILAIEIFRDLTRLDGPMEYITSAIATPSGVASPWVANP